MRLIATAMCLVATLLSGCGGESCADVADDSLVLLEDFFAEVDTADYADAAHVAEVITEIEARAAEIDRRTECSAEEMDALMSERFGGLSAETEIGQVLLDLVLSGALFGNE